MSEIDISLRTIDLASVLPRELLVLQATALRELRRRNIVRTNNAPAGDYAELLFAMAFGWTLAGSSSSGHDAVDNDHKRYQIKCRRITAENPSRQLSALRKLDGKPFDYLAAVLLGADIEVMRAAIIPHEVVVANSIFTPHVNAHRFILRDNIWNIDGVSDVTPMLKRSEVALNTFRDADTES
jgi:hypothetical protein